MHLGARFVAPLSAVTALAFLYACSSSGVHPPIAGDQGGHDGSVVVSVDGQAGNDAGFVEGGGGGTPVCVGPANSFSIQGDDYIAANKAFNVQGGPGWVASIRSSIGGAPTYVSISFNDPNMPGIFWSMDFSSVQLGKPLAVGNYTDAQRASFAASGHAGLDVSGDGRGCNMLGGNFTVTDIQVAGGSGADAGSDGGDAGDMVDAGPLRLTSFTASFEQFCENGPKAAIGCVHFQQP